METFKEGQELQGIWLVNEKNPDILLKSRIVVSDATLLNELVEELKDLDTYIFGGKITEDYLSYRCVEHNPVQLNTSYGAVQFENFCNERQTWHTILCYVNPRSTVTQLLTKDSSFDGDLLTLFDTNSSGDCRDNYLQELESAKVLIKKLEECLLNGYLDKYSIEHIIKSMWPNFGFYASEVFNCTDIETIEESNCNINELYAEVKKCKAKGNAVSNSISDRIEQYDLALNNGKVLSLGKQVHQIIK